MREHTEVQRRREHSAYSMSRLSVRGTLNLVSRSDICIQCSIALIDLSSPADLDALHPTRAETIQLETEHLG